MSSNMFLLPTTFLLIIPLFSHHLLLPLLFLSLLLHHHLTRPPPTYLLDFACALPPTRHQITISSFSSITASLGLFSTHSSDFQSKIALKSGLGDQTHVPTTFLSSPPDLSLSAATAETHTVLFDALDSLFLKTGVDPKAISFLVVNCCVFNPTPSLSAIVVNKYRMREDVRTFNLGGMGCSAGVIAVDVARSLLRVNPGSLALVVSTENITVNWYFGNDRSMLLPNCIFRMGCAAVLLSNRSSDKATAKYRLVHTLRTHKGANDQSYNCINHKEDEEGKTAISLGKDLMMVAGEALTTNITTLGPLVLPLTEQFKFMVTFVAKKVLKLKNIRPYVPDFKKAFEHFCVHSGGRAVLDAVQKNLRLSERHMEASRMTLHRFGNTSSSSLWYELAYLEGKRRVRKGDRIWQIAFGSGFKCNSAVWSALRNVEECDRAWAECIHRYPVQV